MWGRGGCDWRRGIFGTLKQRFLWGVRNGTPEVLYAVYGFMEARIVYADRKSEDDGDFGLG